MKTMKLPETDTCFFCDLLEAGDHWSLLAQCSQTATFLNGRQFEVGQSVVVPRRHVETILELNDVECQAVMSAARRISAVMMDKFKPEGILIYQNNGEASGQEVPHFHLHVVPRQPSSDWRKCPGPPFSSIVMIRSLLAVLLLTTERTSRFLDYA